MFVLIKRQKLFMGSVFVRKISGIIQLLTSRAGQMRMENVQNALLISVLHVILENLMNVLNVLIKMLS